MEKLKAVIALSRKLYCYEQEGSHSLSAEKVKRILTGKGIIKSFDRQLYNIQFAITEKFKEMILLFWELYGHRKNKEF